MSGVDGFIFIVIFAGLFTARISDGRGWLFVCSRKLIWDKSYQLGPITIIGLLVWLLGVFL